MRDTVRRLEIEGLKCIRSPIALDLSGLQVLIGENGTGKSTILQALEMLRQAASPVDYTEDILRAVHGGPQEILNDRSDGFRLNVQVEGQGPRLEYEVRFSSNRSSFVVSSELLLLHEKADPLKALERKATRARCFDPAMRKLGEWNDVEPTRLALTSANFALQPAVARVQKAFLGLDCQAPWLTTSLWQQWELKMREGPRWPSLVEPAHALQRFGLNLPSCFQQLKNSTDPETWNRVLLRGRQGLGEGLRDFRLSPAGRGMVELELVYSTAPDRPRPLASLSDGQVSYLCFVALCELNAKRSLLALDEPELHLHPGLLKRVVMMLDSLAQETPVLLATHSNQLLDALPDPAASVVLCKLDYDQSTRLLRPDPQSLKQWLDDYQGVGTLRSEGYERYIFPEAPIRS